jgi:hypothetical protein
LSFFNKRKEGRKEERKLSSPLPPPPSPPPYSQVSQNYFFRTQPANKQVSKQVTAKTKSKQSKAGLLSSSCSLAATVAAIQGSYYRNRTEVATQKQTKLLKLREEAPHPKCNSFFFGFGFWFWFCFFEGHVS